MHLIVHISVLNHNIILANFAVKQEQKDNNIDK